MPNTNSILPICRKLHLYLGLVFAPSIIFFAFTGAFQLFDLHSASKDGSYQPPAWLAAIAQVHIHQSIELPRRGLPLTDQASKKLDAKEEAANEESTKEDSPKEATARELTAIEEAPKDTPKEAVSKEETAKPRAKKRSSLSLKYFFLLLAIGLIVTTILGVYMSFAYMRSKLMIFSLLTVGILVPIILLNL